MGSQAGNSGKRELEAGEAGHGGSAAHWFASCDLFFLLSYTAQGHLSRGDAALGLVSSWLTMKVPTGQSDGDSFLIDSLSFSLHG